MQCRAKFIISILMSAIISAPALSQEWSANKIDAAGYNQSTEGFTDSGYFLSRGYQGQYDLTYSYLRNIDGAATYINNGAMLVAASSVNNSGQVVGWSQTGAQLHSGNTSAFVTGANGQSMADVQSLGDASGAATAISNSGRIVGNFISPYGVSHAYLTGANGVGVSDLGTWGTPVGVNDSGEVVGVLADHSNGWPNATYRSFATDGNGNNVRELDAPGFSDIQVIGINKNGQAFGTYAANGGERVFITGGHTQGMFDVGGDPLHDPNDIGVYASAINDGGYIVGSFHDSADACPLFCTHAFISGGKYSGLTDLNSLVHLNSGLQLVDAIGINNVGQVLAEGSDSNLYLLTNTSISSVPEPGAGLLCMVGAFVIVFSRPSMHHIRKESSSVQ